MISISTIVDYNLALINTCGKGVTIAAFSAVACWMRVLRIKNQLRMAIPMAIYQRVGCG